MRHNQSSPQFPAVGVFEPMGCAPIPANIQLIGVDDDSVKKHGTTLCNLSNPSTLRHLVNFDDAPCDAANPCDWHNNNINDVQALVDTSAVVTCTGQQHVIHSCTSHSKLRPSQICLQAALDTNQSAIPKGHVCLGCRSADRQEHLDVHVHCHPSMNGTLSSPIGMIKST